MFENHGAKIANFLQNCKISVCVFLMERCEIEYFEYCFVLSGVGSPIGFEKPFSGTLFISTCTKRLPNRVVL